MLRLSNNKLLKIGYIRASFGLKGELKAKFNEKHIPQKGDMLYFEKDKKLTGPCSLISIRSHGHYEQVMQVSGCSCADEARKFSGSSIGVYGKDLGKGAYWVEDIIGCKVYTADNNFVGEIKAILPTGANDIYEVISPEGREILIPALKTVIENIDIENKKIVINPPPGLLD